MDTLSLDDVLAAARAMLDAPNSERLRYFATPSEFRSARWREWFAANYPSVDLVAAQLIPGG